MLRIVAVLFIVCLTCLNAWGNPLDAGWLSGGGKDSLAAKTTTEAGVKVQKLNISPASVNPNFNQVARWDTIDINMYHVDMTSFKDTLTYTLHDEEKGVHFHPPHAGKVTSGFGPRKLYGRKFHKGIDIDLETGDEVSAAMEGKVRIARYSSGYGNFVVISHEGGLETLYGHLSELWVTEGETVDAGSIIGLGGSTGQSTGSHLHFELRVFGEQVDPEKALDRMTFMPLNNEIKVDLSWFDHLLRARGTQYHVVEEGETWDSICKMYEMDQHSLFHLNQFDHDLEIKVGMRIILD